jgi:hypothetical protein
VLRTISEWWEVDLTGLEKAAAARKLAEALGKLNLSEEVGNLEPEEVAAFQELVSADGRIPVATFERTHGAVRLMGPGRMEREEPWLDPVSAAESLWYPRIRSGREFRAG